MARSAAVVPIKLTKAVITKSREKMVRTSALEFSDSAVKSDERRNAAFFKRNNIISIV